VVSEPVSARLTRLHNDANILAMGERIVGVAVAKACLEAFLSTEFEGGRHASRIEKLTRTPQDAAA
jgi:ribose 5-phosphate isomerase B